MLRTILAAWMLTAAALGAQTVDVHVVNSTTGNGIPDVALYFLLSGQTAYSGATDAGGHFQIEAAKEGSYTATYETSRKFWPVSGSPSVMFQVAGGADPVHVEIEMVPMGKISGRVLDGAGKPVPNARVDLQEVTPPGGGWIFKAGEKGEYSHEELRPGTWVLAATPPPSWAPPESPADQPLGWAHTFYPGATSRELAAPIVVLPGGEFRDMDIKLAAVPVHRIRGVVLDVSGHPVPKLPVTLDRREPPSLHQDSRSDGTFEIAPVVDGECRLSTTVDKDGVKLRAAQWVQIKGRDLENVELRLIPPFSIQGKIVMEVAEGAAAPKTPGIAVRPADMFGGFDSILPGIGFFDGNPDGKGDFTIKNLYPGPYQILPGSAPAPYYLDSIRFGARDALESNAQILPGDLPLTVIYKRNGGTVRGTVEACAAGQVMLIPQDPALRRDGFVRRASCDQNGRFEILAVRPGEYYGLAVAAHNPAAARLSGFGEARAGIELDQNLINQSTRVIVRANEATLADLHLAAR